MTKPTRRSATRTGTTTSTNVITLSSLAEDLWLKRRAWRASACAVEMRRVLSSCCYSDSSSSSSGRGGGGGGGGGGRDGDKRSDEDGKDIEGIENDEYDDEIERRICAAQERDGNFQVEMPVRIDKAICLGLGSLSGEAVGARVGGDGEEGEAVVGSRSRSSRNSRRRRETGSDCNSGKKHSHGGRRSFTGIDAAASAAMAAVNRRRALWQLAAFLEIVDVLSSHQGMPATSHENSSEMKNNGTLAGNENGNSDRLVDYEKNMDNKKHLNNENKEINRPLVNVKQLAETHDLLSRDKRQIAMYAQDPAFTTLDVAFLRTFGVLVVPCDDGVGYGGGDEIRDQDGEEEGGERRDRTENRVEGITGDGVGINDDSTPNTPGQKNAHAQFKASSGRGEALAKRVSHLHLDSGKAVDLDLPNDCTSRDNSITDTNISTNSITAITPSTFIFAPFLEHKVLLKRLAWPHSSTSNTRINHPSSITHSPYPFPSPASSSSTTAKYITPTTPPPNTNPSTAVLPNPGPALYIGTDIAEAIDAFNRQSFPLLHHEEKYDNERSIKNSDFTLNIPRRQRRRQRQEQRRKWQDLAHNRAGRGDGEWGPVGQRQQLQQQKVGRPEEEVKEKQLAAADTFLAFRPARKSAFPVFDLFPLAFKGLWVYWVVGR